MIRAISVALVMAGLSVSATAESPMIRGKITSVYDGDTMTMEKGLKIRLCGINAPERNDNGGIEARDYVRGLVLDKRISCTIAGRGSDTPCQQKNARSFERIVAQCFVNGKDIGDLLVDSGHATDISIFTDGYYDR